MPTKIEKDVVTGTNTTGHEWDGLKELNTPLPKWWLYVLYATIAWAAVWFVLYPSVPGVTGYFHGLLGYSQRTEVKHRGAGDRSAACQHTICVRGHGGWQGEGNALHRTESGDVAQRRAGAKRDAEARMAGGAGHLPD